MLESLNQKPGLRATSLGPACKPYSWSSDGEKILLRLERHTHIWEAVRETAFSVLRLFTIPAVREVSECHLGAWLACGLYDLVHGAKHGYVRS